MLKYLVGGLLPSVTIIACSAGGNNMSSNRNMLVRYEHAPSIKYFETGIVEKQNLNGPPGSEVFSSVSVSNTLDDNYKIWINFYAKQTGQKLNFETVDLKSKTINLSKSFSGEYFFETESRGLFRSSLLVFESLPREDFPDTVTEFNVTVVYRLDDSPHTVSFDLERYEFPTPIH